MPVLPATSGDVARWTEVLAPRSGLYLEGADEPHAEAHEPVQVAVHAEAAADGAGMDGVDGYGGGAVELQPLGQLAGEQDVGELRAAVGLHALVVALALEVVETHAAPGRVVTHRRQVDDTARRTGA